MREHKSELIHNLGNNLITIGSLRGSVEILNTHENFFVAEVMNEITHLPHDTFLIPFLQALGIQTASRQANDVISVKVWDLDGGYLNANRVAHMDGLSVQSDATVILNDSIVLFEFKRPHKTPSMNYVTLEQLGRQVLLALKHQAAHGIKTSKIILINNSAPQVHIPKIGRVMPGDVIGEYFREGKDKWLKHPSVENLLANLDGCCLKDVFMVITWNSFIETALTTIDTARRSYDDAGIDGMFINARKSIEWFYERRKHLL